MSIIDLIPPLSDITQNQFLIGGVGTMLTGAGLWALRSIPNQIWNGIKGCTALNLDVTTRHNQYNEIALLLGNYLIKPLTRQYAPAMVKHNRYTGEESAEGLTPGFGRGFAYYRGTLISFERRRLEGGNNKIEESMSITFLTRSTEIILKFLDEARSFSGRDRVRVSISGSDYFSSTVFKERRDLTSVFVPESVKTTLISRFQWFLDNESWYRRRGIPYKFCSLLYGPPGTGKTSLIHALASNFGLNIAYVTSLSSIDELLSQCKENDLVVIEDIDSLAKGLDRAKDDDEADPVVGSIPVLHRLLNVIDGFCTPHGLKVVMTTNHPERLDPALLRSGRTDLKLEIGPLGPVEIRQMFRAFYEETADFAPFCSWKGSDLQELFLTHSAGDARRVLMTPTQGLAA
jgi:chaperone BCS1